VITVRYFGEMSFASRDDADAFIEKLKSTEVNMRIQVSEEMEI